MASYNKNRTTTLYSLIAVVGLIYCDTVEQFRYYYELATKDNGGRCTWHLMYGKD